VPHHVDESDRVVEHRTDGLLQTCVTTIRVSLHGLVFGLPIAQTRNHSSKQPSITSVQNAQQGTPFNAALHYHWFLQALGRFGRIHNVNAGIYLQNAQFHA